MDGTVGGKNGKVWQWMAQWAAKTARCGGDAAIFTLFPGGYVQGRTGPSRHVCHAAWLFKARVVWGGAI